MRLLMPEDALVLDEQDNVFWHRTSEFSQWSYFFLIFSVLMFLRDWVFDGCLLYAFGRDEEWVEFSETLVILVAASIFQVYHYHQEQSWMDADHKVLKTSDSPDGHDQPDGPEEENEISEAPATPTVSSAHKEEIGDDHRGSNASTAPIFNTTGENTSIRSMYRPIWQRLRKFAKWTIFGLPVFRAVANWKDLKEKEKRIEGRRANRAPVDADEVGWAVTKSERDVCEQTFQVIEQFFETLPQSVVQVCLAARANEPLRLDSFTDGIRLMLIIASLLMTAFSSTKYTTDYCRHLKILHFQDYIWFGYKVDFARVDWPSTFLIFFMHLIVIVTRFFCICYAFVVYGQIQGIILIAIIYFVQYIWLQLQPSCRLMYENPPRGITTNYQNGIDRWTNVFTFHLIKPTVRTIAFYNFLFLGCTAIFTATFDTLSATLTKAEISNHFFNYTNPHQSGNDTSNPITFYKAFSCFPCVLASWVACTFVCFVMSWELEKRMQPFFKTQFPLSKGFPFWQRIMRCMTWEKVDPKFRRFICLCILANDEEFGRVFNTFCCNVFCNLAKPRPSDEDLNELWGLLVTRMQSGVPTQLPILRESWELVKRDKHRNNYMKDLLELVDSAFRDGDLGPVVIPMEHLNVFLNLVKNFELNLSGRNSLRLHRTEEFINQLRKENGSNFNHHEGSNVV